MILVVGGIKGGSGKSLTATSLTVLRAVDGHDVLLIDADDQASATTFTRQRQHRTATQASYTAIQSSGADVANQVRHMTAKYDDIVIDVGGRDTTSQRAALAVADLVLLPFAPKSVDLWTDDDVAALIDAARTFNPLLQAVSFLNMAFPRGTDNAEAAAYLRERAAHWTYLDQPIGMRKAFSNAFGQGYTVTEFIPKDPKAIREMTALYRQIFGTVSV